MNYTISQILHVYLLDEDQNHWPNYVDVIEIAIKSTFNANFNKALFEVLYSENTLLPFDWLLSREFYINPHANLFASKMQ